MTDITKKVEQWTPTVQRSQSFTQADGGSDDIILVKESLGRPASHVAIESEANGMSVRFNVYHTVFPQRAIESDLMYTSHLPNLTSGVQIEDTSGALVCIQSGETFTLDNDMPVSDIKLVTTSGIFDIFVS